MATKRGPPARAHCLQVRQNNPTAGRAGPVHAAALPQYVHWLESPHLTLKPGSINQVVVSVLPICKEGCRPQTGV